MPGEPLTVSRKSRRWGIYIFRQVRGAPLFSLGIHIDLHTPRLDLYLPVHTVCIGRIVWQETGRAFYLEDHERWSGHTDDCWHREAMPEAERARIAGKLLEAERLNGQPLHVEDAYEADLLAGFLLDRSAE